MSEPNYAWIYVNQPPADWSEFQARCDIYIAGHWSRPIGEDTDLLAALMHNFAYLMQKGAKDDR